MPEGTHWTALRKITCQKKSWAYLRIITCQQQPRAYLNRGRTLHPHQKSLVSSRSLLHACACAYRCQYSVPRICYTLCSRADNERLVSTRSLLTVHTCVHTSNLLHALQPHKKSLVSSRSLLRACADHMPILLALSQST